MTLSNEVSPLGASVVPRPARTVPPPLDQPPPIAELLGLPPRRVRLPVVLFLLTCVATFWAGVTQWMPGAFFMQGDLAMRRALLMNWQDGLIYMVAVLAIIFAHEMGHFLATVWYRVPASLPFFIPMPIISPIGTMGAVISMAGHRADRKQIFDIGIAGPLAGLVVAIPVLWFGVQQLDLSQTGSGMFQFDIPWLGRMMLDYLHPEYRGQRLVWGSQVNPLFMAGWVGMVITGLNMLPVGQLDGGHVVYCLFRKRGNLIARGFFLGAIAYIVFSNPVMWLMLLFVGIMGTDHPPTANDRVPLGWFRNVLGIASLSIPALCFPLQVVVMPS